jgi:hypothetical protein
VQADQLGIDHSLLSDRRDLRMIDRRHGQRDVDDLCTLDNVSIGHDVAVRVNNHPGADRVLAGYERRLTAAVFFYSALASDKDLNHRWRNSGGELLDGGIQLLEHRWRFGWPRRDRFRLVSLGHCLLLRSWGRRRLSKSWRQPAEKAEKQQKPRPKRIFLRAAK